MEDKSSLIHLISKPFKNTVLFYICEISDIAETIDCSTNDPVFLDITEKFD